MRFCAVRLCALDLAPACASASRPTLVRGMQLTISLDTKWIVVGATAVAAVALLVRAHKKAVESTTIWWIRKHKRYTFAPVKPSDLIVITDFDATLSSGDSEQCHDLIGFSKLMSSEFRDSFAPLLDW